MHTQDDILQLTWLISQGHRELTGVSGESAKTDLNKNQSLTISTMSKFLLRITHHTKNQELNEKRQGIDTNTERTESLNYPTKILKQPQKYSTLDANHDWREAELSSETMEARRTGTFCKQALKEKNCQPRTASSKTVLQERKRKKDILRLRKSKRICQPQRMKPQRMKYRIVVLTEFP